MTKLVIALTLIVIVAALLIRFQAIIAPLLMAFILAYLFYPLASLLNRKVHLTWKAAVAGAPKCRLAGHTDWRLPTIKELYSLTG